MRGGGGGGGGMIGGSERMWAGGEEPKLPSSSGAKIPTDNLTPSRLLWQCTGPWGSKQRHSCLC